MELKPVDSVTLAIEGVALKDPVAVPPVAPAQKPQNSVGPDKVDIHGDPSENSKKIESMDPRAGNIYDYTINSQHDVVIKVKDIESRKEVKEIPSKAEQKFRQAYEKVVSRFIDRKA